jgi:hypothetical protein
MSEGTAAAEHKCKQVGTLISFNLVNLTGGRGVNLNMILGALIIMPWGRSLRLPSKRLRPHEVIEFTIY